MSKQWNMTFREICLMGGGPQQYLGTLNLAVIVVTVWQTKERQECEIKIRKAKLQQKLSLMNINFDKRANGYNYLTW